MNTSTHTSHLTVGTLGPVAVTSTDRGQGQPLLLLHGGAGPQSVTGFADLLAETTPVRVITPTHPGFGGTPRAETLTSIAGLAETYTALLADLDLSDVTVIGNSIGGWIAAEMAVRGSPRISSIIFVDAVGIEVEGHPVADFFALTLDQVVQLSFHNPERFRIDPATMSAAQQAAAAGNRTALAVYGGEPDSTLRARLGTVTLPTLVLWGDSDQIVDPDYGRAYAAAIPSARFQLLTDTGHVPQIETPQQLLQAIWDFARTHANKHASS
jgi:pimeloyl-ACP methyl ester carboxylesterase